MRRSFLSAGAAIDRELLAMTEAFTDEIVAEFPAPRLRERNSLRQCGWRDGIRLEFLDPEVCAGVAALWVREPWRGEAARLGNRQTATLPHPALGQDLTPSSTARRAQAGSGVRAQSARRGARVDSSTSPDPSR
jgi:hypothetical protein